MKKIYHLSTCNTCQRILKELAPFEGFTLQDVKEKPITQEQLERLRTLTSSYESLFNRRAQLYRKNGLHEKQLAESDYKKLLLEHYTFLKRPVVLCNDVLFIGNSKKVVSAAKEKITS